MKQLLAKIAFGTVKDYDEAIAYYTQKLNFELKEVQKTFGHKTLGCNITARK